MSWKGESQRHAMAARGINTSKTELISQINRCQQVEGTMKELSEKTCRIEERNEKAINYILDILEPIMEELDGFVVVSMSDYVSIISKDNYYNLSVKSPRSVRIQFGDVYERPSDMSWGHKDYNKYEPGFFIGIHEHGYYLDSYKKHILTSISLDKINESEMRNIILDNIKKYKEMS